MMTLNTQTSLLLAGVAILVVIAIAALLFYHRNRTQKLQHRFGAEYDRTVEALGSRTKAEAELEARKKRVETFNIVPLLPAEAERLRQAWIALQARFVDDPKGVVIQANQLVRELMLKRGFPMADFERLAADISVDHPDVVQNYRAAQAIAERDARGEADTEELRNAVVHYRALFDELLEVEDVPRGAVSPQRRAVSS
jgi:hypothetical protein